MRTFGKLLFIIPFLVGWVVILLAAGLLLATVYDYRPPDSLKLHLNKPTGKITPEKTTLTFMTWNIGYAGLGKEMDFFYDGGKQVRPAGEFNVKYFDAVRSFIRENDSIDFIMLQEVDRYSRRSYFSDQAAMITSELPGYAWTFTKNYDVPFVPVPFTNPMGKVVSGLMTLSEFDPHRSDRVQFPGNFSWPKRLFMLDRCFLVQYFNLTDSKNLILINTHNSAFDDGTLRQAQMDYLKSFALKEFENGNYVVIGGDWNQNPPAFSPGSVLSGDAASHNDLGNITADFLPAGWQWVFDSNLPTNRFVDKPYSRGTTKTTIIDFFVVSPNVNPQSIKTIDLAFASSDHNPVLLQVKLN